MIFDFSTPVLSKPFIIVQRLSTYFVAKECINDSGRQWYKNSWIFRCQLDVLLGNYGSFGSPGVRCAPLPLPRTCKNARPPRTKFKFRIEVFFMNGMIIKEQTGEIRFSNEEWCARIIFVMLFSLLKLHNFFFKKSVHLLTFESRTECESLNCQTQIRGTSYYDQ